MHPREIQISHYTYNLPEKQIAKYPLSERDESRLLVWRNSTIQESSYKHLHEFIPQNSLMVFNNTRVIQARLLFKTNTGATIEVFCLEPEAGIEPNTAMQKQATVRWQCLVGSASKWKEKNLSLKNNGFLLNVEIVSRTADVFTIEFTWQPRHFTFAEILACLGAMPIPPYLKRESSAADLTTYQTVYAKTDGSVAAPTAGLHFTPTVFESLTLKNISIAEVTLHVGAGTFKPVKTKTIGEHSMHAEWFETDIQFIEQLIEAVKSNHTIIAVGTTSLRTIESLYWMGVKAHANISSRLSDLEIKQWDVYDLKNNVSAHDALSSLATWLQKNGAETLIAKTQILIAPPYKLKIANALVTNFHQPTSTLLLLVASIVGDNWKKIYQYALKQNFRFLSYGDGSLLFAG